ncbi:hypothetical protein B7P43_G13438, partial [Cryptotermes secundus]
FTYLGSEANCKNDISDELKKHVLEANKCLHGLRKHLKSRLVPRKTKTMMYKVLIRSVLSYASETWPLSRSDERLLSIFERGILRYIFGPVEENGIWRKGYNHELYKLFNEPGIIGFIMVKRLELAGHIIHASENRTIKKILNTKPEGNMRVGGPRLRWEECVWQNIRILGVKNWRNVASNGEQWRAILRKAKAHKGLSCQ